MIRQLIHTIFKSHRFSGLALLLIAIALPWPIKYSSIAVLVFCTYLVFRIPEEYSISSVSARIAWLAFIYFLLHLAWWIFTTRASLNTWPELEKKLALAFFPYLLLNQKLTYHESFVRFIYRSYCFSLAVACLVCLIVATVKYSTGSDVTVFFYHTLCSPIHHHAVYLSAQCIIGLLLIYFSPNHKPSIQWLMVFCFLVFSLMIILLASKLMIGIFGVLLCIKVIHYAKRNLKSIIIPFAAFSLLLVSIFTFPFLKQRFIEISPTHTISMHEHHYGPQVYFDGLSLSLLQWRIGNELLTVGNRWLIGVGPYQAQHVLDQSYRNLNMYQGINGKGGYLGLNFHNQYLESTVRFGVIGIIVLLLLLVTVIQSAINQHNTLLLIVTLFLMVFFLTESVIETQRGLILFLFFVLLNHKTPLAERADD